MIKHQTQCEQILLALQKGPRTSWQLQQLGICCHTKRISELRKSGVEIVCTEKRIGLRRIVTYSLRQPTLPGFESAVERTGANGNAIFRICAECQQAFIPSSQARPLKLTEKPFCSDAHRAAYHRKHAQVPTENPQRLHKSSDLLSGDL